MSIYVWVVVIFVIAMCVIFGIGWLMERADRRLERITLLAQLDEVTDKLLDRANDDMLPRAGRLPYQGAQDPAYQLAPIPWDLAGAAYALGQQRARQDDVSAEVDAIFAEVEGNPERWRR